MNRRDRLKERDKVDEEEEDEGEESALADQYDVLNEVITVHSDIEEMNADFTLSYLRDELLKSRIIRFIKEQIKATNVLIDEVEDDEIKKKIKAFMMKEINTITVLSRAYGGLIIKKVVEGFGHPPQELQSAEEEVPEKRGFFDKLLGRKKGK